MTSESQILITGCYRSGTEYTTQLINNNPEIAATMYLTNFMRFSYNEYNPIHKRRNYTALVFDNAARMRYRWNRNLDVHSIIDKCEIQHEVDYGYIYDLIMSDMLLKNSEKHWAEKTQLVWTKIPDFLRMFDTAKSIIIIRDPRSVLASFKNFTYAERPEYLGAIFNTRGVMDYASKFSEENNNRVFVVKYEDVILEPTKTLKRIFNFLDAESDHDLLSTSGWVDTSGKIWKSNSSFEAGTPANQFDKSAALDRWQQVLEPWEIELCELVNKDLMKKYGYGLSNTRSKETQYMDYVNKSTNIRKFYKNWISNKEGVEEFPIDPVQSDIWRTHVNHNKNKL
jgi:hypothetical protein